MPKGYVILTEIIRDLEGMQAYGRAAGRPGGRAAGRPGGRAAGRPGHRCAKVGGRYWSPTASPKSSKANGSAPRRSFSSSSQSKRRAPGTGRIPTRQPPHFATPLPTSTLSSCSDSLIPTDERSR